MRMVSFFFVAIIIASCQTGNDSNVKTATELVDSFSHQILIKKDSSGIRSQFVEALDSLQLYEKAIAHVDTLILKDSLNNTLWLKKGQLHESNRDTLLAIRSYENAVKLYPSVDNQLYLANLLAENRNPQALRICANVVSMAMGKQTDAYCDFIAGVFFSRTNNKKKAIDLFDKAIMEDYTLMEAYMEKGFIYFDAKNYSQALLIFEKAITINNQYADAYYWKAKCNEAIGNKDEALLNYQRSLGLDKNLKAAKAAINRLENK